MSRKSQNTSKIKGKKAKKVFVGLSGGVDSAVSAALLKRAGYDVTGVFIKVWQPDFLPCTWREERRDAMRVAIALDIPFLFFDFEEEYKKGVVDKVLAEYKLGRTPNPDVLCNKEIKFGAFWKKAKEMGADFIATGHYTRVEKQADFTRGNALSSRARDVRSTPTDAVRDVSSLQNPLVLKESKDKEKDQSYFLWTLTQGDLSRTLFPIGNLEKEEVRSLARGFRLPVAEKKDSQGICFIGEVSMEEFLSHFLKTKIGKVVDTEGQAIGEHDGAQLYTIGERRGFKVEKKSPKDGAYYVVAKDIKANTITVSSRDSEIKALSPKKISLKSVNWIVEPPGPSLSARIRYRGKKVTAILFLAGRTVGVEFPNPPKALSLGQSIVFYDGDTCLGGGVMDKVVV